MKHAAWTIALMIGLAAPAAAQWPGEPLWSNPKAGTGLTISGDYAHPDSTYGKGNTWGGRVSLGLGTMTFTAGVSTWKPEGPTQSFTSVGGTAAFRLIGGSLIPVAVGLELGAAHTDSANATPAATRLTGGAGMSIPLPTPGFTIEPYFAPGLRYTSNLPTALGGGNSTEFGYAVGANVSFGVWGIHLAYDSEKQKVGGSRGVFGVGAHVGIHLPLGM
ncbi:MAG TPA: hypothetical protein VM736_02040 [Gemmatimonadales bacterium]|nr:hypothetical protein [Gemmatimonadales bacterium]